MVGDKLRRERERQRLSVKDVEQGTSIRALYIEAIEQGNWETLPGDVYTKGFIRNIATFLKLDGDACVSEYVSDTAAMLPDTGEVGGAETAATGGDVPPRPSTDDFTKHLEKKRRNQTMLMAVMLLIVVAGAGYLLATMDNGKQASKVRPNEGTVVTTEKKPSSTVVDKPAAENNKPAEQTKPAEKQPQQPPKNPPADNGNKQPTANTATKSNVELTATFNDRCWMKVVADGAVVYEGTVEKGKTMSWKGSERIAITAGNAGALNITHNGKNVGQAGAYGEVVNRTFTKDGAVN